MMLEIRKWCIYSAGQAAPEGKEPELTLSIDCCSSLANEDHECPVTVEAWSQTCHYLAAWSDGPCVRTLQPTDSVLSVHPKPFSSYSLHVPNNSHQISLPPYALQAIYNGQLTSQPMCFGDLGRNPYAHRVNVQTPPESS